MRLVHTADGKAVAGLTVHSATGFLVLIVEGTTMLVYHNTVLLERAEAVAIKFLGKKACSMAQRINRITDN